MKHKAGTMPAKKSILMWVLVFVFLTSIIDSLSASSPVSSSTPGVNVTGLDVALKTLAYLESLPVQDNRVVAMKNCGGDGCVVVSTNYKQYGAWMALAYVGLYNATGETIYLDKARESMSRLLGDCDPDSDPDCLYVGVQAEAAYTLTKDASHLKYLNGLNEMMVPWGDGSGVAMLNGIGARELVLAYKHGLYNEPAKILQALKIAAATENDESVLLVHNGVEFRKTVCWGQLAYIDFYRVLAGRGDEVLFHNVTASGFKSNILLQPVKFFSKLDFESLSHNPNVYTIQLLDLEPCAESLINLYEITGDEKYKREAVALLSVLLENNWDSEYSKKYVGDNGFTSQGCSKSENWTSCYNNPKLLNENAHAAYLFARLYDTVFTIPTDVEVRNYKNPQEEDKATIAEAPALSRNTKIILAVLAISLTLLYIYLKGKQAKRKRE